MIEDIDKISFAYGTMSPAMSLLPLSIVILLLLHKQESQAIADKPARRESIPKIAPIRRTYNVIAVNTGLSSFV